MKRDKWKFVYHTPVWVAAPLRVDREGNTKPGFLCIYELQNGKGLCAGNVFEVPAAGTEPPHCCLVKLRDRWNVSRPCYDKYHRCPGWAGGGWKGAKDKLCRGDGGGYVKYDYDDRWWKWKTHHCDNCGVTVLPYMIRWTDWRSWWLSVRYARNSWRWLFKLETWWGKKRGWW